VESSPSLFIASLLRAIRARVKAERAFVSPPTWSMVMVT
jgi:hypothetical protein